MVKKDEKQPVKKILITKEGLVKLELELEELKTVKRREVSARLQEAISYGDLSENAEYDEAKNEQAFVEARINELEEQIKLAEIIKESKDKKGTIEIGSTVKLKMTGGEEHEYEIVGSTESDPAMRKISNESPVGAAVLGKKVKDIVEVVAPGGKFKYEILKVS